MRWGRRGAGKLWGGAVGMIIAKSLLTGHSWLEGILKPRGDGSRVVSSRLRVSRAVIRGVGCDFLVRL